MSDQDNAEPETAESESAVAETETVPQQAPAKASARFADDRALYGSLGRLLRDALDDNYAGQKMKRLGACVQLRFRDPDAVLTALLRGAQSQVDFGPSRLRPDATIAMDGDVGHGWLIGEVNPTSALSDGRMKTRGPNATILNALALIKVLAPAYKQLLADTGDELPESLDASLLPEPVKPPAPAAAPKPAGEAEAPVAEAEAPVADEQQADEGEVAAEAPAEDPAPADEAPAEAPAENPAPVDEAPAEAPADDPAGSPEPAADEDPPAA